MNQNRRLRRPENEIFFFGAVGGNEVDYLCHAVPDRRVSTIRPGLLWSFLA